MWYYSAIKNMIHIWNSTNHIKNNREDEKKIQSVHYENFITLLPRTAESKTKILFCTFLSRSSDSLFPSPFIIYASSKLRKQYGTELSGSHCKKEKASTHHCILRKDCQKVSSLSIHLIKSIPR